MKKVVVLLLAGMAFLTTGCASIKYQELAEMPTVSEDEGLIFFFRERELTGSAITFYIYEGEERIGALANGSFFFIAPTPGTHVYYTKGEQQETLTLDVKAGETYYIQGEVKMGMFSGRPDLTIVHELEGKSEIPNLKYGVAKSVAENEDTGGK